MFQKGERLALCVIIFSFLCLLLPVRSFAVPAAPVDHILTQSDGTEFTARMWGDEWLAGWQTTEGYTIVYDRASGDWKYAIKDAGGNLVPSANVVGQSPPVGVEPGMRPSKGAQAAMSPPAIELPQPTIAFPIPPVGQLPALYVTFSDRPSSIVIPPGPPVTPGTIDYLLFGPHSSGSVNDYYTEVSYGAFSVAGAVDPLTGPPYGYVLPNPHAYYGADGSWPGDDVMVGDLVIDAIIAADPTFNFAPFDTNNDCYVDTLAVVHQGTGQEASAAANDMWSKRWDLYSASALGYSTYTVGPPTYGWATNDFSPYCSTIYIHDFIIMPELEPWIGGISTIGVFAHEYGHALGLPDLYDRDGSSKGIGDWGLMAGGSWNWISTQYPASLPGDTPAHLSAWSKYVLGWVTPTQVTTPLLGQSIQEASTAADVYQLLPGLPYDSASEYFLVENRQQTGFDAGLPGAGLLIWHIDETRWWGPPYPPNPPQNDNECIPSGPCDDNYWVSLEQADGYFDLESNYNYGDSGDPFPYQTNTAFTPSTAPNSNFWDTSVSDIHVMNISASGPTMYADLAITAPPWTPPSPVLISPTAVITSATPSYDWNSSSGADDYRVVIQDTSNGFTKIHDAWYTAGTAGCSGGGVCSVVPAGVSLTDGNTYRWYIMARNTLGTSPASIPMYFRYSAAATPPAVPTLTGPSIMTSNPTPAYSWNEVPGALEYRLVVQDTDSGYVKVIDTWYTSAGAGCSGGTCAIAPAVTLTDGNTYRWYVQAANVMGVSSASAPMYFLHSTLTMPVAPTLNSPSGTGTATPTYSWNEVAGAAEYRIVVQDWSSGRVKVIDTWYTAGGVCSGGVCTVTPGTSLTVGNTYRWFVQARNILGTSPASLVKYFEVQ